MIRPAAVLFDLDDTLYPERSFVNGGFAAVGRFLAGPLGKPADELTDRLVVLHDTMGRGALFDHLIREATGHVVADLVLASVLIYRTHEPRLEPFPGTIEALDGLRSAGVRTGLVSDGHSATQKRKLDALAGVADRLDAVVFTDDIGREHAKPSATPFRVACRVLDVAPSECVYVANDARKDFIGARAAGLRTIQVGRPPDEGRATMPGEPVEPANDADVVLDNVGSAVRYLLDDVEDQGGAR